MAIEVTSHWMELPYRGEEIAQMLNDGWEIVSWQPLAIVREGGPGLPPIRQFEVFLLRRET